MSYSLTDEQQADEQFWIEMAAELQAEQEKYDAYVATLTEEEYYMQFVLPYQDEVKDEDEELTYETSIGVI